MDISTMNPEQFGDMFGLDGNSPTEGPKFGSQEQQFPLFDSTTETTTLAPSSTTETTTIDASSTTETTTLKDEADMFSQSDEDKKKVEEKQAATGLENYFQERIKEGKLVAVKQTLEDGTEVDFVPTTPEEVDEYLDIHVNHRLEEKAKEVEENWYKQKSPAWKYVAQYAEMIDNPAELLPLLQGVQNIQNIASINVEEVDGAEQLVRMQLQRKGLETELIDTQIEALKNSNKIVETAQKLQPAMVQEENQRIAKLQQEEAKRVEDYRKMVIDIRDKAIQAIEQPLGKLPLKDDEKSAIYELIAVPSEETKGYAIYNKIDELFDKGDFDTLRQVALFLANKESFLNYIATGAANKTAEGLQKKLRVAGEKSAGGKDPEVSTTTKSVQRNQYSTGTPRFGR